MIRILVVVVVLVVLFLLVFGAIGSSFSHREVEGMQYKYYVICIPWLESLGVNHVVDIDGIHEVGDVCEE